MSYPLYRPFTSILDANHAGYFAAMLFGGPRLEAHLKSEGKLCRGCGRVKHIIEFYQEKRRDGTIHPRGTCILCYREGRRRKQHKKEAK